jgi:glycosyltransferase involved in cell wall biosynthesis
MNIVHIDDFFHPDAGYQENILSKYQAQNGHKVTFVTSEAAKLPKVLTSFFNFSNIRERDLLFEKNTGVKVIRIPLYAYISGRSIYYESIFKTVDSLKPDILYVHGNDSYIGIRYAFKLKKLKYPVVFDNHMHDKASRNKFKYLFYFFYRNFITPKILKSKAIVIKTIDFDFVQRRHGIPVEFSPVIGFGSDLLKFHPDYTVKSDMRKKYKISPEDFVVIYAGKFDEAKGGLLLARTIQRKIRSNRKVVFMLIGTVVGAGKKEIENTLNQSENRIIRIETQPYVELPKFFQCADMAVFANQSSLTFFDVQACGLPVVLNDSEVNIERVKHNNGVCFKSGDADDFRSKIEYMANLSEPEYRKMSECSFDFIKTHYDYQKKADEYQKILDSIMKKFCNAKV